MRIDERREYIALFGRKHYLSQKQRKEMAKNNKKNPEFSYHKKKSNNTQRIAGSNLDQRYKSKSQSIRPHLPRHNDDIQKHNTAFPFRNRFPSRGSDKKIKKIRCLW